MSVDIACFSEVNLDTSKFAVVQQLYETLRKEFPHNATLQVDSSSDVAPNFYKPGGTAVVSIGAIVGRLEPSSKKGDSMGRWSRMSYRRKGLAPLTVISVYQVCSRPTNPLGHAAWHQQTRGLSDADRSDTSPRKAFIDDLIKEVRSLQALHHDVIVAGDFNETLDDPNSGVLRFATSTGLVDAFLQKHPGHPDFPTHHRGSKRIDSAFVSPRLAGAIRRAANTA